MLDSLQRSLLERAAAFLRIPGQAELKRRHRDVLGLETQPEPEGLLEPAQGQQTAGNQHKANRYLDHDQGIPKGQTPWAPRGGGSFEGGIGISSRSAPCRN